MSVLNWGNCVNIQRKKLCYIKDRVDWNRVNRGTPVCNTFVNSVLVVFDTNSMLTTIYKNKKGYEIPPIEWAYHNIFKIGLTFLVMVITLR